MSATGDSTRTGRDDTDFVDESIRELFEHGWLVGPKRSIEECLPDGQCRGYLATLEELVCIEMEFAWRDFNKRRYATMASPSASTAAWHPPSNVETYCRRFPVLQNDECVRRLIQQEFAVRLRFDETPSAQEYQQRFPELPVTEVLDDVAMAGGGVAYEQPQPSLQSIDSEISLPVIAGYQVERRIGMGGMGVVYRARQLAADRTVAIKLIRGDRLESLSEQEKKDTIDRLSVEAQATARLEHPHVISLFEVNIEDPLHPWFSMQYVDGETLAERLQKGPVESRTAAQMTRQITDAIQCAHENGVLHRDLKPQNVFLRAADDQVLVGDFGLAKIKLDDVQRTSHDDILGTPAYMAPEQVQDSANVTEAADVWSIGATLYHLLTGRPPFQAATAMETLRQVLEFEPIGPRQLNPVVDRDLETICLKCLQKSPAQRYATASDLRHDLVAYLEQRPISARPVGTTEKIWRWCRRNPRPATFAALAIVSVFVAFGALFTGYRTADDALKQSLNSLSRERRAREDSDASHALARQTVDDLFTEVSETVLLNKPGMQPLRRRLLNRTLSYYRVFAESGRHTPAMQNVLGHVWYRIGVIEQELGRMDTAESAFDTAVTIQTKLANASSSSQDRLSLSTTLNGFGVLRMKQQRVEDARELFERALDLRVQLLSSDIDEVEIRRLHANTVMNLGTVDRNQGRAATARGQFREAARQYRTLLDRVQGDLRLTIQLQRELAKALFNSANAAIDALMAEDASDVGETDTADRAEIRQLLVEANQLFRRVLEYEADSYPDRRRLAWCLQMQVECAADEEEAMALYREAIDELQRLASENRSVPELTVELAQVELSRGRLAADTAQFETAVQDFESGLLRLQQLSAEESQTRDRDIAVFRAELTLARAALGLVDSKMIAEALQEVEHQLAIHADDHELLLLQRQLRQARQPTVL